MAKSKSRISVTVGTGLQRFLDAGGVGSDHTSTRVDVMAARYLEITKDIAPKRWTAQDWRDIIEIVRANPPIIGALQSIAIATRLRQIAKGSSREQELSSLAYRFEQLHAGEQMAAVEMAEQAIAIGAFEIDQISAWMKKTGWIA
ncbi:MAG: hypothetical protein ACYC9L_03025 [Sulfuricaulis sp.]